MAIIKDKILLMQNPFPYSFNEKRYRLPLQRSRYQSITILRLTISRKSQKSSLMQVLPALIVMALKVLAAVSFVHNWEVATAMLHFTRIS